MRVEKDRQGEEPHIPDLTGTPTLERFDHLDQITAQSGRQGNRFLLVTRRPLQLPVT